MEIFVNEFLLSPSKVAGWLSCAHSLTLERRFSEGDAALDRDHPGEFAALIQDKGLVHEASCLEQFRAEGRTVFSVPAQNRGEAFVDWIERIGNPLLEGYDVIFQMPLIAGGIRGIADFLVRVEHPESGFASYEPWDAKLARSEAKPSHLLQLCFYAEAIERLLGAPPKQIHVWLGSGSKESHDFAQIGAYWRRQRMELASLLEQPLGDVATEPEKCTHCAFCSFQGHCERGWRETDSLVYVANISRRQRVDLVHRGISTIAALAKTSIGIEERDSEQLERLITQAHLQVVAREQDPNSPPPIDRTRITGSSTWGQGYHSLPAPDVGDVFFDLEGHPFWRADSGLFFLFGLLTFHDGEWIYEARWAHDKPSEREAAEGVVSFLEQRRFEFPNFHCFHYNHTERSALEAMVRETSTSTSPVLAELIKEGRFVDLLPIVRNAFQVGVESYGLKSIEKLTGYQRAGGIERGSGAVLEYDFFLQDPSGGQEHLETIARYNDDDVRATLAVRDWLVSQRDDKIPWRGAVLEANESESEELSLRQQAADALFARFDEGSPEHLLAELLFYWDREWIADQTPKIEKLKTFKPDLLDDKDVLIGLELIEFTERLKKDNSGEMLYLVHLRFPEQVVGGKIQRSQQILWLDQEEVVGRGSIEEMDLESRTIVVSSSKEFRGENLPPVILMINDWVQPKPKPGRLLTLANQILEPDTYGLPNPASMELLRRQLPSFVSGGGPADGIFTDDASKISKWSSELVAGPLVIQGPPGTGKTFTGTHVIHYLVTQSKGTAGITAFSHEAIDNLLFATVDVFDEQGTRQDLKAGRNPRDGDMTRYRNRGISAATRNHRTLSNREKFNLVAGTSWFFANKEMVASPEARVGTLVIDEAGQLSLADALVCSMVADRIVLLGDSQQLAQVTKAVHPKGAGASVLEHLLQGRDTIPNDEGILLTCTRRMHPNITTFISDQIYDGRLTSAPHCAHHMSEVAGSGLRWVEVDHADCSTESKVEAQAVVDQIAKLTGTMWTDGFDMARRPLTPSDFMVVAPFNDQVNLLRTMIESDPRITAALDSGVLEGGESVRIGTVDKFQGQQAPVVLFSMTTSSGEELTRGVDFNFSRNRLNVAISRAKCLVFMFATRKLLATQVASVADMKLVAFANAYVEQANLQEGLSSTVRV